MVMNIELINSIKKYGRVGLGLEFHIFRKHDELIAILSLIFIEIWIWKEQVEENDKKFAESNTNNGNIRVYNSNKSINN